MHQQQQQKFLEEMRDGGCNAAKKFMADAVLDTSEMMMMHSMQLRLLFFKGARTTHGQILNMINFSKKSFSTTHVIIWNNMH